MITGRKLFSLGLLASALFAFGMPGCSADDSTGKKSSSSSSKGGSKNKAGSDDSSGGEDKGGSDDRGDTGGSKSGNEGGGGSNAGGGGKAGTGGSNAGGGGKSGSGGSKGTGGSTSSTGGSNDPSGTGGSPSSGGSGGTPSTSSCPKYAGSVKTDSKSCTDGYCEATVLKGYAFTFPFGDATVVPDSKANKNQQCFSGAQVCASGSIPADDASGAAIGINISQPKGGTAAAVAVSSITYKLDGFQEGMRVQLSSADGDYCAALTAASGTVDATKLKTECWGEKGKAYAGETASAVHFLVPGASAASKKFDFCVVEIDVKTGS